MATKTTDETHEQVSKGQTRITRNDLAKSLDTSYSTMRKYERLFSDWLNTPKGRDSTGQRYYTLEDVQTLTVIHSLRKDRFSFEAMLAGELDQALNTGTWTHDPEKVSGEDAQANAAVVPIEQYSAVVAKYHATEGELTAVSDERDRLVTQLDNERQAQLDAEKRAALAEGKLNAVTDERDRLLAEKDTTPPVQKDTPPAEKDTRNWWQRLTGKGIGD